MYCTQFIMYYPHKELTITDICYIFNNENYINCVVCNKWLVLILMLKHYLCSHILKYLCCTTGHRNWTQNYRHLFCIYNNKNYIFVVCNNILIFILMINHVLISNYFTVFNFIYQCTCGNSNIKPSNICFK